MLLSDALNQKFFLLYCSEYHRIDRVGRNPWRSSSPNPCQGRVTCSMWHKIVTRWGLNVCREEDSTTSLGSLLQCSSTLNVKKFFLMLSWKFLWFSLWTLLLVLSLQCAPLKKVCHPPFGIWLWDIYIHQWDLLSVFSRLNRLSSCSLSSYKRCSRPLIVFVVIHWTLSSISLFILIWF